MSRAGGQSGFTLLELIAALTLAGLLLALVPPLLGSGGDRARLDHDRRALLSILRLARSEAILSGRTTIFRVDPIARRFRLGKTDSALADGVELTLETPLADRSEIRFFADGSASGGKIDLANAAGQVRLQVDWLTGKAALAP